MFVCACLRRRCCCCCLQLAAVCFRDGECIRFDWLWSSFGEWTKMFLSRPLGWAQIPSQCIWGLILETCHCVINRVSILRYPNAVAAQSYSTKFEEIHCKCRVVWTLESFTHNSTTTKVMRLNVRGWIVSLEPDAWRARQTKIFCLTFWNSLSPPVMNWIPVPGQNRRWELRSFIQFEERSTSHSGQFFWARIQCFQSSKSSDSFFMHESYFRVWPNSSTPTNTKNRAIILVCWTPHHSERRKKQSHNRSHINPLPTNSCCLYFFIRCVGVENRKITQKFFPDRKQRTNNFWTKKSHTHTIEERHQQRQICMPQHSTQWKSNQSRTTNNNTVERLYHITLYLLSKTNSWAKRTKQVKSNHKRT